MAFTGSFIFFLREASREETFSFFLLTQRVLVLQKKLKLFLIVTAAQRNICAATAIRTAIGSVVQFVFKGGLAGWVLSFLTCCCPGQWVTVTTSFIVSSFQKVSLILAKCEKNLILSLFYWTAVMLSMGAVHQQYFTALIANHLSLARTRVCLAGTQTVWRLEGMAKSTFLHSFAFRWNCLYCA